MHTLGCYWLVVSAAGNLFVLCSASKNNIKSIASLIKNVFVLHGGAKR